MRLPRFRLRTLLLLVALVALALGGWRVYLDGHEAHWLLLKLRYGNVNARRSAAIQIRESEGNATLHQIVGHVLNGPPNPRVSEEQRRRGRRRAELLLPALIRVANDSDPDCRVSALFALDVVASFHGSEREKSLALGEILAATRDRNEHIRTAAVGSLATLGVGDPKAVLNAIRSALSDPSVEVRKAAAEELGMLGYCVPEARPDAASIAIPLLASREDSQVRVKAAWGLCYVGTDDRRRPAGGGPDVVPALVCALRDPDVDVRRAAATILGSSRPGARGQPISSWARRKHSIVPALQAAISDADKAVRQESARALFALGQRNPAVVELIEQAVRDPTQTHKLKFEQALKEWQREQEASDPVERTASDAVES